jgi:predicted nucleotidyltransferase/DNA-binding XRE family transcriptional regulator
MTSAATIVREARQRAGLTQTELASAAGVEQSVVSAYETGKREPGFETLRKLVAASGLSLTFDLVERPAVSPLRALVELHRVELVKSLTSLGASNIRLFGSVARGDDGPNSDIDLLVDVADTVGLFELSAMSIEAKRILGVDVDVVPSNSTKPALVESILSDAVAL